ncbi:hypothetical protein CAPTEDRAFT_166512 [Capitella teleta]|uniref:Angiotensin-converting enzyme n=1 Tax=Capitella teleta TaxID=283909 RepID=R7TAS5_CAPTE|nr:hypothetical protein CAPTEDRAFT_166512 [Capitella teleta]|eukprot:ELT90813.1 hypothetical protein CAPTEDRAFT_166512 [Capitella teleta]
MLILGIVGGEKSLDEGAATLWLNEYNHLASSVYNERVQASWNYYTNLTDHNQHLMVKAELVFSRFEQEAYRNASIFDWKKMNNETIKRLMKTISYMRLPEEEVKQTENLRNRITQVYSTAEVCGDGTDRCLLLEPDLQNKFAESKDWDELSRLWKGWRDETGRKMKSDYEAFVKLQNKAAKLNGFDDNGHRWRAKYETEDFPQLCEKLWNQVSPLYVQLHAYVKRQLKKTYADNIDGFPDGGHIPAHLLGNMWGQTWDNIFDLVVPFPDKQTVDVTSALQQQKYNATAIFRLSEDFFESLGLDPMPEAFWEHSMITRPTDREVVCHASAWDFYNQNDFRIKMCTEVTQESLLTVHHEMGHVHYFIMYKDQPVMFRRGANSGFHEALGDLISMSVVTPKHLQLIGLLEESPEDNETELNFLMKRALERLSFLPFGYLIDQWRWSVFSGETDIDSYNRKWWELRCKYQGISPPVSRSESDFDPGAKFHIPNNTPYIRYFISSVLQYQFQRELCNISGHTGPLHRCDIYGSKEAGTKLRNMLMLGQSKPWPDALEQLTGQREMDATAIIDYFRPLMEWLKEQNAGHDLSWEEECPHGSFTSGSNSLISTMFSLLLPVIYIVLL